MSQEEFKKLPGSLLQTGRAQRLFEAVWKGIAAQVEDRPFVLNSDRLAKIPVEAQTIYWLWRFQSEAGAGGFEVFVLDSLGINAPQIHAALKMIGATDLAQRLESSVALARNGPAEFKKLPDQTWFNQFTAATDYPTLQSIDNGVFPAIRSLTDTVAKFIRSKANILFHD